MSKVTVAMAVVAMEAALKDLKALPQDLPVNGNFDQGGYTDCGFPLQSIGFSISHWSQEDIDKEYAGYTPDPEDELDEPIPTPEVNITAVFISD